MKQTLIGLGAVNLVAVILAVGLWLTGHVVAATVVGTATLAGWFLLTVLGAFAAGMWWDRESVRMGADIALRSQESDDRRDMAMIRGLTVLTQAVMKQSPQHPALPLPSQDNTWLPELPEFDVVDAEIERSGSNG